MFTKNIKSLFIFLSFISSGAVQAKEAQSFTGYYRELTPLCNEKAVENVADLPEYSGIRDCYEGKKRMGTAAKFWVIQNGQYLCGYWEIVAKKVWSGALVGRVKEGNKKASVFYEDGHQFGGDAPRYIFEKSHHGDLKVTDFDYEGFPANVKYFERVKASPIDLAVIKNCNIEFLPPFKINEHSGEMVLKGRPDSEVIQKSFGDVSDKVIHKAPPARTITLDKQTKTFWRGVVRRDNNFLPMDVLVRNRSKKSWFVQSICMPESISYFDDKLKLTNFKGEVYPQYKRYAVAAMTVQGQGAPVKPGETIRVLLCRGWALHFQLESDFN
jgi:hypothetical protein